MAEAQADGAVRGAAMNSFSIWHVFLVVLILVVLFLPVWFFSLAVKKAGFSPWWALLGIVPLINIIMLWVFAFVEWPALRQPGST
jgi:uncharacterized membrane protein YhaH (DUF805 family)